MRRNIERTIQRRPSRFTISLFLVLVFGWAPAASAQGPGAGRFTRTESQLEQRGASPPQAIEEKTTVVPGKTLSTSPSTRRGIGGVSTTRTGVIPGSAPTLERLGEENLGACCRFETDGREVFRQLGRQDCVARGGTIVNPRTCRTRRPSRPGSGDELVCCQMDSRPESAGVGFKYTWGNFIRERTISLVPASECKGSEVDRSKCVKHRTRAERLEDCRRRGEDWAWEDNRCQRTALRDKRDRPEPLPRAERFKECRERGEGWEWKNERCQRSEVRDKRNRR